MRHLNDIVYSSIELFKMDSRKDAAHGIANVERRQRAPCGARVSATVKLAAERGNVIRTVGATGYAEFALGERLADAKCDLNTRK